MVLLRTIGALRMQLQLLFCSALVVSATVHHLYVGTINGISSLYAVEFDDEKLSLKLTKTFPAVGSHSWICFSVSDRCEGNSFRNNTISYVF